MAGVIVKQFSQTPQPDGTAISIANSNLSSISIGSGNSATFLATAAMNEAVGYRFTQGSAGTQLTSYFDLDSAVPILSLRVPLRISATPSSSLTFLRGYVDTGHATVSWSVQITTTLRINFIEQSGATTSTGTGLSERLVAGTDYVIEILVDTTAQTFSLTTYERGLPAAINSMSGALTTSMPAQQSVRYGINTTSGYINGSLDTNSSFAIGSGGLLARTDISNFAPTLTLSADTQVIHPGETATITAIAADSDGTISSLTWSTNAGTLVGSGGIRTITAPALLQDLTVTIGVIATDDKGATVQKFLTLTFKASMSKLYTANGWVPTIRKIKL